MLAEFIKMTTTTATSGDITLSAVSGFPAFADAFAIGEPISFAVLDDTTGAPYEICQGHLSASTTLVIDDVVSSYVSGTLNQTNPTAVTLPAGTKRVICTPAANGLVATPSNIPALSTNNKRLIFPDGQMIGTGGHGSVAVLQNIVYYIPIIIKTNQLIDAILFRLTTVQASSSARVGIYTAAADGKPGIKLIESSLISTAANSPPEIVCALTSRRYKPALHYLAVTFTGGASGVTVNGPSQTITATSQPLLGGNGSMLADIAATYESTSGGTLPATAAVTSGFRATSETPLLALRLA